jgi:two-component system nitrogen regulation sensor histidine kinase GlnL
MKTYRPTAVNTVLVVDDERIVRELCTTTLADEGYRVLAAEDAEAGLRLARQEPVGAILLDLILPGMSGFDALRTLTQEVPEAPVVVMTAYSSESRVIDLLKLGAYDFLLKPFEPANLTYAIRRALERHRLLVERWQVVRNLREQVDSQTRALARGRQLLQNVIEHMGSGLLVTDRDGRIWMVNQQGEQILGVSAAQAVGQRLLDLFPGAGPLLDERGGSASRELDLATPGGRTIPLGFDRSHLRAASGQAEGTIILVRDLTEMRAIQAEARRKERLATIGEVVAGVAHEIRNPLFGISSVVQILATEVKFDPAHQDLLAAMQAEIKRLSSLVEDLLHYGRPSRLDLSPHSLEQIWDEILGLAKEELAAARVEVTRDVAGHLPPVLADGDKLRQVFLNLLRNSVQATSPGGQIAIRLHRTPAGDLPAGIRRSLALPASDQAAPREYVVSVVADTGAGIPAAALDRVFDLFFTTKSTGSGLGLPICRRIVEDHAGAIGIESTERVGTTVTVALPM